MSLHTTFNLLKKAGACGQKPGSGEGYDKLAQYLGGVTKYGKNTPIPLTTILDSNGLDDALWCLRAVLPEEKAASDKQARLFACDVAEHVLSIFEGAYPNDPRPRQAIETSRRFAIGAATQEELAAAWDAAWDATRDAAWDATRDAAWDATRVAAWVAARVAAWVAAWDATRDVAQDVDWVAARDVAWDVEREWQTTKFREMLEASDAK